MYYKEGGSISVDLLTVLDIGEEHLLFQVWAMVCVCSTTSMDGSSTVDSETHFSSGSKIMEGLRLTLILVSQIIYERF